LKEKFEILCKSAQKKNSTVVFKNELSEGHSDPDAIAYMREIGTKVFLFLRTNLLDDLSCRVKDFCDKPENEGVGVNVDASGKELGCAFRGRGEDEAKEKYDEQYIKTYTSKFTPMFHSITERKPKTFMKLVCFTCVLQIQMLQNSCDRHVLFLWGRRISSLNALPRKVIV